jgi:hypothetical protein
VVEAFTCTYHVSTAARNTNLSVMDNVGATDSEMRNRAAWARCKTLVEQRKAQLLAPLWWAHEQFGVVPAQPSAPGEGTAAEARRSLRERAVRKAIRMLERLL